MIEFECPACRHWVSFSDDQAGERVKCPACSMGITVPGEASGPLKPAPSDSPKTQRERYVPRPQSSRLAREALILGLCSFIPILGIPLGILAIIFGLIVVAQGQGRLAVGGIVAGLGGAVILNGLILGMFIPSLGTAREPAKRAMCKTNLSGMGKGLTIYLAENNDEYPFAVMDPDGNDLKPTTANNLLLFRMEARQPEKMFVCPSDSSGEPLRDSGEWNNGDNDGAPNYRGTTNFSYSYQAMMSSGVNGISSAPNGSLVIMADKVDAAIAGNVNIISPNHDHEMQNFLCADSHVSEGKVNQLGVTIDDESDNIFTASGDKPIDPAGSTTAKHLHFTDSFLVGP